MTDPIPTIWLDRSGIIRVGQPGVSIDDIVDAHRKGHTDDAILARFPGLTCTQLTAALDYHLHEGDDALQHSPQQRDAHWRKWNATLEDDMGTDTPPNEPIAGIS